MPNASSKGLDLSTLSTMESALLPPPLLLPPLLLLLPLLPLPPPTPTGGEEEELELEVEVDAWARRPIMILTDSVLPLPLWCHFFL